MASSTVTTPAAEGEPVSVPMPDPGAKRRAAEEEPRADTMPSPKKKKRKPPGPPNGTVGSTLSPPHRVMNEEELKKWTKGNSKGGKET